MGKAQRAQHISLSVMLGTSLSLLYPTYKYQSPGCNNQIRTLASSLVVAR